MLKKCFQIFFVIPVQTEIQFFKGLWIPAFAGITSFAVRPRIFQRPANNPYLPSFCHSRLPGVLPGERLPATREMTKRSAEPGHCYFNSIRNQADSFHRHIGFSASQYHKRGKLLMELREVLSKKGLSSDHKGYQADSSGHLSYFSVHEYIP
jgi:hypothetical protein